MKKQQLDEITDFLFAHFADETATRYKVGFNECHDPYANEVVKPVAKLAKMLTKQWAKRYAYTDED